MPGRDASENHFQELVAEVAAGVAASYRIGPEEAAELVAPLLASNRKLLELLAAESDPKRLRRMRVYKSAVAAARKAVYFSLRRYRQDEPALLEAIARLETLVPRTDPEAASRAINDILHCHVSTAERLPHFEQLQEQLVGRISSAASIVDVGAGVFPLLIPWDRLPALRTYLALDRDAAATRAVQACAAWSADGLLTARHWNAAEGWQVVLDAAGVERFDLALLLKLVPVVQRREPGLVATLGSVPARRLIVSGSREAMVKRRSIADREAGLLTAFARRFDFLVVDRFETDDEVGLVLERPACGK